METPASFSVLAHPLLRSWAAASMLVALIGTGLAARVESAPPTLPPERMDVRALRAALELASDFSSSSHALQEDVVNLLQQQGAASDAERLFAAQSFAVGPDQDYGRSVEAEGKDSFDYLRAARASHARYRGAQGAPDQQWMETHLRGARYFAGLAADTLLAEAALDEDDANRLRNQPLAIRRAPDKQAVFIEQLRRDGLLPAHRQLLLEGGRTEAEVQVFTKQLLDAPADTIGISAVELLSGFAAARRQLAEELRAYASAGAAALAVPAAQTFIVYNPYDRPETIDLKVRRVSIPASWKLAVVDAPEPANPGPVGGATSSVPAPLADSRKSLVQEVRTGEHYRVVLPAKGQIRVASVVVPIDSVGENTTARWSVEGYIGKELLGGMMHEMNVPPVLAADPQLPPIAPMATSSAGAVTRVSTFRSRMVWLTATVSMLLVGIFFIAWRRKRSRM